jgi:hypothetical protein
VLFPFFHYNKFIKNYHLTCCLNSGANFKHPDQISSAKRKEQTEIAYLVMLSQLEYFKIEATEQEKSIHLALMNRYPVNGDFEFNKLKSWANFLLQKNTVTNHYHPVHLAWFFKSLLKNIFRTYELKLLKNKHL